MTKIRLPDAPQQIATQHQQLWTQREQLKASMAPWVMQREEADQKGREAAQKLEGLPKELNAQSRPLLDAVSEAKTAADEARTELAALMVHLVPLNKQIDALEKQYSFSPVSQFQKLTDQLATDDD